jgi:hypothetical protein
MKKTYINPELEIVKIATHQMLAASNTNMDLNVDVEETDINNLLSREVDNFDDEDDFDFDEEGI